jgi:3-hydroxyacyl-[acyl-carrier-protein] dehydratase
MRWIWIDRFVEFESGKRAVALKNVSLAEEHLHDHFPGRPVMPNSLITEGIAQTGGLLVGEFHAFEKKVVLAKIPKAVFHFPVVPGDTLRYEAVVDYIKDDGAMVTATAKVGDRLQAELEVVFAHLADDEHSQSLFEPKNFVFTMKLLGVFEVGRKPDGGRLTEPPGLLKLEQELKVGGRS